MQERVQKRYAKKEMQKYPKEMQKYPKEMQNKMQKRCRKLC